MIYVESTESAAESPRRQTLRRLNVILYPNPARDEIKIRHSYSHAQNLIVEFFDYTGRKVKIIQCGNCDRETGMDVSEFASGLYTYKVIVDNSMVSSGKLNIIK